MNDRRNRLDQMMGAVSPQPQASSAPKVVAGSRERRRVLLFAPSPAKSTPYLKLLEEEGFDVVLAQDPPAAESLLRSTSPGLIVALAPAVGADVLDRWREVAPQIEVRVVPSLAQILEERLASPKDMLEFTIRVLSFVSGMTEKQLGIPTSRDGQVLHVAEKAAKALEFDARRLITVRLAAVLGGLAKALHADAAEPHGAEGPAKTVAAGHDTILADFAQAMGCPFPVGSKPPAGPRESRSPTPEELVEAATRLILLREQQDPDPTLALRRLALANDSGDSQLHPAAVEAVLAAAGNPSVKEGASILLVDGDNGSRNLLALRLSNEGYAIRTSGDGRSALEEIRREPPGLVLAEAVLPGLDGFALLDAIKREGKSNIPFVFLSSRADPLSINKGLLLGAVDFIAKPVNFEVLLTKLEKMLAQAVDLSGVSARLSLSDVTMSGNADYPPVQYDELRAGTTILGRFNIEADLGEGGMGKVFKARDERLEEQVVIKVMKPGFSDDVLRRFKREIRLARKITHPGVVRIFDFWEAGPLKFVTMEFLEGTDLRAEIKRRGAFPVPVALRVGTEIFEALAAAHEVGVVHRDMKPHNVVMLPSGKIKVLDFGIAQGLEQNTPDSATVAGGAILGTPEYMSPEQLLAERLDPRTDLYSVGVMLYELLTGELPFPSEDRIAGARMRLVSDPAPPTSKKPDIPDKVEALVLRLLQRKRDERYTSATEVLADLNRLRS
jgi:DNA-binding response OmpR family regulator